MENKFYCADCKKETPYYVSRCYECKTKWYDSYEFHYEKCSDEEFLYD